jgi:hypothetical protein
LLLSLIQDLCALERRKLLNNGYLFVALMPKGKDSRLWIIKCGRMDIGKEINISWYGINGLLLWFAMLLCNIVFIDEIPLENAVF